MLDFGMNCLERVIQGNKKIIKIYNLGSLILLKINNSKNFKMKKRKGTIQHLKKNKITKNVSITESEVSFINFFKISTWCYRLLIYRNNLASTLSNEIYGNYY